MEKQRKKEVTIEAILYTYYLSKEGTHPVRVKVTANRSSRFYPVQYEGKNIFLTKSRWEEIRTKSVRGSDRKIQETIIDAESKARSAQGRIMQNDRPFDFARFEAEYLHQESKKGIIALWEDYLRTLLSEDRAGSYVAYKNALQAFKFFRGLTIKDKIVLREASEINPASLSVQVLKDFDSFLSKRGCGKTTIAMYMRALKIVYNIAANENQSLKEFYPFAVKQNDKAKYKIKNGGGSKGEALTPTQLQNLVNIETIPGTQEHEAKLLWLFSLYCQGMNFKDIALLKYSNIQWDCIRYVRKKTRDTESIESEMQVPLNDTIRQIIVDIGNPDKSPNSYVFGILSKGHSAVKLDAIVRQKIKTVNKWLKRMCERNDLPAVTTYWARHSYANLLKQSGESIEMIRELLGHSDMRTTEAYLKRFDLTRKQAVNEKIHAILKAS